MQSSSASTIFITMPFKWIEDKKYLKCPIGPSKIINIISEFYAVPVKDMESHCRKHDMVLARQMAIYMLKHYTRMSLLKISSLFGNRDHTTAIHSIKTINNLCDTDSRVFTDRQVIHHKILQHFK